MWIPSDGDAAFIAAANPAAVLALFAEIAALRAKNEAADKTITKQFAWAASKAHRATEAERKLANAEGLLKRIAEDESYDGPSSARLYFGTRVAQ